ncbi:hypothetical protein ACWGJP_05345 [Microbacterium sp. NPDC055903]
MPTNRPRYQVTETDDVARALDAAEVRWPGEPRSRLIVRLITENGGRAEAEQHAEDERRARAVESIAGRFRGMFPRELRDELRDEWPE